MVNLTECNISHSANLTSHSLYINECLGVRTCVLVEECSSRIREYIFPDFSEWIIIAIYSILFTFGLVGNGLVCFVVIRITHMRTIINIFIVNLAVADFLVLLICLPPSLLADTTESWYLGDVMCKIVPFLQTVSVAVSVLTLTAISVERYFAICHPLWMRLNTTIMSLFIFVIWFSAVCIALPELIYQHLHDSYPKHVTSFLKYCRMEMPYEQQKYYQIFLMIVLYDLPMCLMFFAYTTISIRLWKDTFSGAKEDRCLTSGRRLQRCQTSRPPTQVQTRRKAAKMLMTIVILFAVCYLPVHVLNILKYNGNLQNWNEVSIITFALVARGLCYFNSAINPAIYNFMSGKFRQEFKAAFNACRCACREPEKGPITLYNFRMNRSAMTRSDRYTMNTLTSRQGWIGQTTSSNKKTLL